MKIKFKNYLVAVLTVYIVPISAQYEGNVGINTSTPTATLNVKGKGNTSATQPLKIENSDGLNLLTITDNGLVSGTITAALSGGSNGLSALIQSTAEPGGINCSTGGIKVESGLDTNTNGLLDTSEVTSTRYVCNGIAGSGMLNGTSGGQIYLTSSSSPYNVQTPTTVTGDVQISAAGVTSISNNAVTTTKINNGSVTISKISATGTPSASTYLRGDGSWQSAGGSGGFIFTSVTANTTLDNNNQIVNLTGNFLVNLPSSPGLGQMVYVISTAANGSVNGNGKSIVLQDGTSQTSIVYTSYGGFYRVSLFIYNGTSWYNAS